MSGRHFLQYLLRKKEISREVRNHWLMRAIYSGIRDLFQLILRKESVTLCLDIVIAVSGGGFPAFGTTVALLRATESKQLGVEVKGLSQDEFSPLCE
jgi:hypothetical protein